MLQKKFNLSNLELYLKIHPKAKNKLLYQEFNATTDSQKSSLRRKKAILNKRNKSKVATDSHSPMQKLSSDDLEKRIVDALNRHPDNAQILGKAIEFFIKVKGKSQAIDDTIDMEALRQIGVNIKSSD